jgi:phosphoserine aminotransferase
MSSDLLSRPIDVSKYALIYAHAQKNLGPAGVTVVIIRDDFLQKAKQPMPAMLDYRQHIDHHSIYNTPPVFAIYVLTLVTQWLKNTIGGLQNMQSINQKKSALLLSTLHELQDKFSLHASMQDQSIMNVCFNLTQPERLPAWLAQAQAHQLHGLQGHRSLGGIRASLYNAVTLEDVRRLCQFLRDAH